MRVRVKESGALGHARDFNVSGLSEVIVGFDGDGGMDSMFIKDMDVLLTSGWKDMAQAFRDHDLVSDNHNTFFREAKTDTEREKGYFL